MQGLAPSLMHDSQQAVTSQLYDTNMQAALQNLVEQVETLTQERDYLRDEAIH